MGGVVAPATHRPLQAGGAARLGVAALLCAAAPAAAKQQGGFLAQGHGAADGRPDQPNNDADKVVAFTIVFLISLFAVFMGVWIGCPEYFGCRRREQQPKRKEKRAVTSQEILERMPPSKTPRASDGCGQPQCVVCLCEVDVDQESITTQCGHVFHKDCVLQWWTHKPRRSIRCPTCRTKQKIRQQKREGDDTSSSNTQVSPVMEELPQGAAGTGGDADEPVPQRPARQGEDTALPDLEAGHAGLSTAMPAPAPSPRSSAPTDRTHPSVADEATPVSQVSCLPHLGDYQAALDTEDVVSI